MFCTRHHVQSLNTTTLLKHVPRGKTHLKVFKDFMWPLVHRVGDVAFDIIDSLGTYAKSQSLVL